MKSNEATQNYALIIGIHDYLAFDPSGNANLPGARNDAKAWYRTCLAMGFAPENTRVLASPLLCQGTAKATIAEATRKNILEHLVWLAERIGGDSPASGLLTFSGHGDEGTDGDLLLCPSDTTPSLEEVIDVVQVLDQASPKARARLTMMLDCCHSQMGPNVGLPLRARLATKRSRIAVPNIVRPRVLSACTREQESVSARFSGEMMGAFSWAVTSTLGQWRTLVDNDVAYVDVSHAELHTRTSSLLSTLSFAQTPVLSGSLGVQQEAFLHAGSPLNPGQTSHDPTGQRDPRQLDGGQKPNTYAKYHIHLVTSTGNHHLCDMYATASSMDGGLKIGQTPMQASTEYWVFSNLFLTELQDKYIGSTIYLKYDGELTASLERIDTEANSYFTASETAPWTLVDKTTWPSGSYTFGADPMNSTQTLRGSVLELKDGKPTSWQWIQTGRSNLGKTLERNNLFQSNPASATSDYYAASEFTSFDPNG